MTHFWTFFENIHNNKKIEQPVKRYLSSILSISRDMSHTEAVNCCDDWTVHD